MPIYTKKGDFGETSLWGGKRVKKSTLRVDAYGTIDELNSILGVVIATLPKNTRLSEELIAIQHDLLEIGSLLADPNALPFALLADRVGEFEVMIDQLTDTLPPLKNFSLPGGSLAGAQLHVARTVCRRAERRIVSLLDKEPIDTGLITYVNRLSDLLFTMARYTNNALGAEEVIWHTRREKETSKEQNKVDSLPNQG